MTTVNLRPSTGGAVTLSVLDEAQRVARFEGLQQQMPRVWAATRRDVPGESVVVVPSISLNRAMATSAALAQAMEERSLFLLLLLRQPRLRMVYVTSMPIADSVVSYYLGLLSGVIPEHARSRLRLVSVGDSSPRSLSEKLLERPRILRRIRDLIPDRRLCHLIPYNTTEAERDVAISLGIPLYGADPRLGPGQVRSTFPDHPRHRGLTGRPGVVAKGESRHPSDAASRVARASCSRRPRAGRTSPGGPRR